MSQGQRAHSSSRPVEHPEPLSKMDGPYLVPWGKKEVVWVLGLGGLLGVSMAVTSAACDFWMGLLGEVPLVAVVSMAVLFFRNPRREVPGDPGILLGPADGRVVEISTVEEKEFLQCTALKVGIFLSIFNVHVNRSPETGRVEYLRYRPGKFLDARNPRCVTENESQAIGLRLEGSGERILVRQISGAVARRIVCPLEEGDVLVRGGLIGMIKYGSRTEIYVPVGPEEGRGAGARWEVTVRLGDNIRGGETVLFRSSKQRTERGGEAAQESYG